MTKEERMQELAEEHKRKDNEIYEKIGLGFDSFKDEDWHSMRMECREDVSLKALAFMVSQIAEYISVKLTSEGHYDFLFCFRKHSNINDSEEVANQMQAIESERQKLRDNFKVEAMKIEAEYSDEAPKKCH